MFPFIFAKRTARFVYSFFAGWVSVSIPSLWPCAHREVVGREVHCGPEETAERLQKEESERLLRQEAREAAAHLRLESWGWFTFDEGLW